MDEQGVRADDPDSLLRVPQRLRRVTGLATALGIYRGNPGIYSQQLSPKCKRPAIVTCSAGTTAFSLTRRVGSPDN
jgi:hypothetical protein